MTTTSNKMKTAVVIALAAALSACSTKDERSDIVITEVIKATVVGGTGCGFDAQTAETFNQVQDITVTDFYNRGLVVDNRLTSNANAATGRLNTNDFEVQSARVKITFPDPAFQGTAIERTVPTAGLAKVAASTALGVQLFTPEITSLLRAIPLAAGKLGTIRVAVRLDGNLLDGSGVQSTEREYVLSICQGCIGTPGACTGTGARQPSCNPGSNDDTNTCQ